MSYRTATPTALQSPPTEPVTWRFYGPRKVDVIAARWFDARNIAMTLLGCEPGEFTGWRIVEVPRG